MGVKPEIQFSLGLGYQLPTTKRQPPPWFRTDFDFDGTLIMVNVFTLQTSQPSDRIKRRPNLFFGGGDCKEISTSVKFVCSSFPLAFPTLHGVTHFSFYHSWTIWRGQHSTHLVHHFLRKFKTPQTQGSKQSLDCFGPILKETTGFQPSSGNINYLAGTQCLAIVPTKISEQIFKWAIGWGWFTQTSYSWKPGCV